MSRVYLSPPHLGDDERALIEDALDSNWIAPLGPHVDAFEEEFAAAVEVPHAAALASGTAAIHLALVLLGVGRDDTVLCSDLTFAASAFPVLYLGATPYFVDCEPESWCIDPALTAEVLEKLVRDGRPPAAVIVVDLYGQSADHDPILAACDRHGVPVIEDAAEALGATYRGRPVGRFGRFGAFSFNGNKIITTSGGGMLVSNDRAAIEEARRLASQARDPEVHYEHSTLGYNYRLSNLLAAVGRGQLRRLGDRIAARRRNFDLYRRALGELPGIEFMPEPDHGRSTRWLTCLTIDPDRFGSDREAVRSALEAIDVESRPVWKPMHLQPLFQQAPVAGGAVSERLFREGLCLPSGSDLSDADRERVIEVVHRLCLGS